MGWQAVQDEVRARISRRVWKPGALIPHEAELARELGCARATVNRALRGLAEAGLLERRRKAGTRVALTPFRRAEFTIPLIRDEIEGRGQRFGCQVLSRVLRAPPPEVQARMEGGDAPILYLAALYTADNAPYVCEDRWINTHAIPAALEADFTAISPNEWLVREVPFDGGDFTLSALAADAGLAERLDCAAGSGLLVLDRRTWHAGQVITSVRLVFHPGYRMHSQT